jgi:(p)ppGpp synthase/HD superfamily hydrolase
VDIENLDSLLETFGFRESDDLLAAVGYGDVEADTVVRDLIAGCRAAGLRSPRRCRTRTLRVWLRARRRLGTTPAIDGERRRRVPLSPLKAAARPFPAMSIVGYVTRGKGLTIHRSDCKNLLYHAQNEPDRVVTTDVGRAG